jgi:hypothetical protein
MRTATRILRPPSHRSSSCPQTAYRISEVSAWMTRFLTKQATADARLAA